MDPKLIAVVALVALSVHATLASNPVVEIGESTFTGTRTTYNYAGIVDAINTVDSYLGVPYAKSTAGDRRFKDPEDVASNIKHDGTKYGPTCVQSDSYPPIEKAKMEGEARSEDCLRLNIYTPYKAGSNDNYPVMVYIHGGSLRVGSANWYDGHVLTQNGVVVVAINYRLENFGFLTNGNKSEIPGDYGIFDQVKALQWIQKNIGSFRGNPSKVTIFGNEAGGWSVNLHLIMPQSEGLFHRAIVQSGPLEGNITHYNSGSETNTFFEHFAKKTSCSGNWKEKVACMREKDTASIKDSGDSAKSHVVSALDQDHRYLWKGSRVFPHDPATLIQSGHLNNVPVMIGTTAAEAARHVATSVFGPFKYISRDGDFVGTNPTGPANDSELMELVKIEAGYTGINLSPVQLANIVKMYFPVDIKNDRKKVTAALVEALSDLRTTVPTIRLAKMLQKRGVPTYAYVFDNPLSMNKKISYLQRCKWVAEYSYDHIELPFLFGLPVFGGYDRTVWHMNDYTDQERELSLSMMKMWTDFAKHGNPTPKGSRDTWAIFNGSANNYMSLKTGRLLMRTDLKKLNQVKFWEDLLADVFPRK